MKKPWRYERRNIFLPFPRNFAITIIISTISRLDNLFLALRISNKAKAYQNQFLSTEIHINLCNGSYEERTLSKVTSLINPTFD